MVLWIIFAFMTAASTLAVLVPLARRRKAATPDAAFDAAVYRDQLDELERDRERGLIAEGEAEAARTEIARRLLRAGASADESVPVRRSLARPIAVAAIVLVPVIAISTYAITGSPDLPGQPLSARMNEQPDANGLDEMVARVERHLAANSGDAEGWRVIAPVYMRIGRFQDAAEAYRKLMVLEPPTADLRETYGEALVAANDGLVSADAQAAFDAVVAADPSRIKSRFYRAEGLLQAGRQQEALADFDEIIKRSPADAPWIQPVMQGRARALAALKLPADTPAPPMLPPEVAVAATPGPSADDVQAAAGMSEADRSAMIGGMVERLAGRLAEDPNDAEGWQRLIRAYAVLGRNDDAKAAYEKAKATFAGDAAKLEAIETVARDVGVAG
jgi:cytochrome c-type biogenesis protein CcmH